MVKRFFAVGLACAALTGSCVGERERRKPAPEPFLAELVPAQVSAGKPFQVQADGTAALAVIGRNLFRGSRVRWEGEPLETAAGGAPKSLAATVPPRLFAQPGTYQITVEQPGGTVSNALPVTVFPASGPAPAIEALFPARTMAGELFNRQPSGRAALALTGRNFLPGSSVLFGGTVLETVFGAPDRVAALVPAAVLSDARAVPVVVRNPDGKTSAPATFIVAPKK